MRPCGRSRLRLTAPGGDDLRQARVSCSFFVAASLSRNVTLFGEVLCLKSLTLACWTSLVLPITSRWSFLPGCGQGLTNCLGRWMTDPAMASWSDIMSTAATFGWLGGERQRLAM